MRVRELTQTPGFGCPLGSEEAPMGLRLCSDGVRQAELQGGVGAGAG